MPSCPSMHYPPQASQLQQLPPGRLRVAHARSSGLRTCSLLAWRMAVGAFFPGDSQSLEEEVAGCAPVCFPHTGGGWASSQATQSRPRKKQQAACLPSPCMEWGLLPQVAQSHPRKKQQAARPHALLTWRAGRGPSSMATQSCLKKAVGCGAWGGGGSAIPSPWLL